MIIVTGASKGIGFAICERFQELGVQVLGIARNVENLPFPAIACDVTEYASLKTISRCLRAENGDITALINAAGIASMNLALTTPPAVTSRIIEVNLMGTIFASQAFAPLMVRNRFGHIINFSTIAVPLNLEGESIYSASKAGIESFTKTLARELSGHGIRVNCVSPGPIETDLIRGIPQSQVNNVISRQVIQEKMSKSDICDVVELLLDPRSKSITGQTLHVGGV